MLVIILHLNHVRSTVTRLYPNWTAFLLLFKCLFWNPTLALRTNANLMRYWFGSFHNLSLLPFFFCWLFLASRDGENLYVICREGSLFAFPLFLEMLNALCPILPTLEETTFKKRHKLDRVRCHVECPHCKVKDSTTHRK